MKIKERLQKDFIEEFENKFGSEILDEEIEEELLKSEKLRPGLSFSYYSLPLYCLCRSIKPENVIETGVQNGGATQAILFALHKNNFGILHSIDSGPNSSDGTHVHTVNGLPGKNVSSFLKERWNFNLGFSYDILPVLLNKIKNVDIFFHDSDHSGPNIEKEFKLIIEKMNKKSYASLHDHLGQWDYKNIMKDFEFIIGDKRLENNDNNVIRIWEKK